MDIFWFFRRKVSVILPLNSRFFNVVNETQRTDPYFEKSRYRSFFNSPKISVSNDVRQVFEICGIPWKLINKNQPNIIQIYHSKENYFGISYNDHTERLVNKTLKTFQPYILVRSKDFLEIDRALMKIKIDKK